MNVKVIRVNSDATEFKVPKGYEPFAIIREYGAWVVFCRPTGA